MKSRVVNGYLLERGIPIPEVDSSRAGRPRKYPVENMKPGACMSFIGARAYDRAQYIAQVGRRLGFTMKVHGPMDGKSKVIAVRLA